MFNSRLIEPMEDEGVLRAINESNFHTLCDQYGLNVGQIDVTLAHLALFHGKISPYAPYLILRYHPKGLRPLLVHAYMVDWLSGRLILQRALYYAHNEDLKSILGKTCLILSIELSQEQLRDMGLLLAYEVARWAAEQGKGLVRGLDGKWYHLNCHQAFIPFEGDKASE